MNMVNIVTKKFDTKINILYKNLIKLVYNRLFKKNMLKKSIIIIKLLNNGSNFDIFGSKTGHIFQRSNKNIETNKNQHWLEKNLLHFKSR